MLFFAACCAGALALAGRARAEDSSISTAPYHCGFADISRLPEGWTVEGDVRIEDGDAFDDSRSLRLFRPAATAHLPVSATGPAFPIVPGKWTAGAAGKVDIVSPDNSYNGKVWLEVLNGEGEVIDRFPVADFDRNKHWRTASLDLEIPAGAVQARFRVEMNKAYGVFLVDALSAKFAGRARSERQTVDHILFSTSRPGNLLFPGDDRTVGVEVKTFRPLPEAGQKVTWEVRDYWGAGQGEPAVGELTATGENAYGAKLDLSGLPLETGRYYEIHASVPEPDGEPSSNYSSLAILPEAAANRHKPEEIPFTSRNWDNRIEEFAPLTHRLGVRICGVWGRWSSTPPYEAQVPRIDTVAKLGMAALTTTPISAIEHRLDGWEKYDEKSLRDGVRNLLQAAGAVRPLYVNLGNEPAGDAGSVRRFVDAYKAVFQEIKKTEPGIFVVGSSAGPQEEFFKAGFGEWCDAYDFHTYGDTTSVRTTIAEYRRLFEKYGHPKPIWSTELGLNSQGLERRAVAAELIRKFTVFFAAGGANASWFGLLYPDRDLKLHLGSEDSHNIFDCRYARYAPRLDAVAYYNMVNGIAVKKFLAEKNHADGSYAALFRDRENRCLQVLWREAGWKDVFVPLDGVGRVHLVRIDGRRRELDAGGSGLSLTIGPDPLLLFYENGPAHPAAELEPAATTIALPASVIRGASAAAVVALNGAAAVELTAPPLWKVKKSAEGKETRFQLSSDRDSTAREADLLFTLRDARGRAFGELSRRLTAAPRLSVRILPEPSSPKTPPGVRLLLANNGTTPQSVEWQAAITESLALKEGKFGEPSAAGVSFSGEASGTRSIEPGRIESIFLPLKDLDPFRLYRVRATAREPGEAPIVTERLVGGFAGVPRSASPIKLDGTLDEDGWQNVRPIVLQHEYQFAPLRKTASWTGEADLSTKVRFLWDDQHLYVGVEVTDDIAGGLKKDGEIWAQDGLQFLIDPARESVSKPGKYDYAVAAGSGGAQAWCYLSADAARAPVGEAADIGVSAKRRDPETGSITYEIAIPWSRVSPFEPAAGANLGFTLIVNEDDGEGRDSCMTWFGDAHTKQVDTAGDLILLPPDSANSLK